MRIEAVFAELHEPIFIAGTNLGQKLEVGRCSKGPIKIESDDAAHLLYVTFKGRTMKVPYTNVRGIEDVVEGRKSFPQEETPVKAPPPPKGRVTAQVSGPHDHVFAGTGAGKTNDKR